MRYSIIYKSSIFFLSLLLICCSEDYDQLIDTVDNIPNPQEKVATSFSGLILDENEAPIEGAYVTIGDEYKMSDENGYFFLSGVFNSNGTPFSVKSSGYFDGFGTLLPSPTGTVQVRILLIKKEAPIVHSSDQTFSIEQELFSLQFEEDSFIDELGRDYKGAIEIYVTHLDPTSSTYDLLLPGGLMVEEEEQMFLINSFGTIKVEIYSSDGDALRLKKEVLFELKVPEDLVELVEQESALWHLNEDTGYWEQEGSAQFVEGRYSASLDHFSSWSFGRRISFEILSGTIQRNDIPYAQADIGIAHYKFSRRRAFVDINGNYKTNVVSDLEYSLSVLDRCANELFGENGLIQNGPLERDIQIQETFKSLLVTGSVSCQNEPIGSSYVLIDFQGSGYTGVVNTDEEGHFEYLVEDCGSSDIVLRGYDVQGSTKSKDVVVDASGDYQLDVCEDSFNGEIILEIDGVADPYIIDNCIVTIGPSEMILPSDKYFFEATDFYEGVEGAEGESAKYEVTIFNRTEPPNAPFGPVTHPETTDGVPFYYQFAPAPYSLNIDESGIVEVTISGPALFTKTVDGNKMDITGTIRIRAIVQE